MAHILPHWTWPERVGQVTPVHVFTSGDEAELFLNGKSLGRKRKGTLRVSPALGRRRLPAGTLEVVAYKNGAEWAKDSVRTAGTPAAAGAARRSGGDFSRRRGSVVRHRARRRSKRIAGAAREATGFAFSVDGPGEIVATDNGDPTSFVPFPSPEREAFNGLALVIVRSRKGATGRITVTVTGDGLKQGATVIRPSPSHGS